uniref:N-acetylmuramoyl-L-alanine amidase n=1 Tax=Undibacterium sp. TaxID=1914977 RepID=UPI00374DF75A
SIQLLTGDNVSVHYLVTDEEQPRIYGMVDESKRAWHAGKSEWKDYKSLGASSIGIEIVNPGYTDTPAGRVYAPFPQKQIDLLMPLIKDIVARNQIAPENILGHSDIAPQRKQDPGPMFPWKQLADAGLIIWPNADQVKARQAAFENQLPDTAWFQKKLHEHGFALEQTGTLDAATKNVISAFQMKYRPANIDGKPDSETAAILDVLTTAPSTIVTPYLEQITRTSK